MQKTKTYQPVSTWTWKLPWYCHLVSRHQTVRLYLPHFMLENPLIYQPVSTWTWNLPWYYQLDSTHEPVHPEDTPVTIADSETKRQANLSNTRKKVTKRSGQKRSLSIELLLGSDVIGEKQFYGYSDLLLLGTWILHNSNLGTIGPISEVCSHQIQKKQNHQYWRTNWDWHWAREVSETSPRPRTSTKAQYNCLDVVLICEVQESSQSPIRIQ